MKTSVRKETGPFGRWAAVAHRWYGRLRKAEEDASRFETVEGAMRGALGPVKPTDSFRAHLHDSLDLAAQSRAAGMHMEAPRRIQQSILIALTATVMATASAVLIVILHARWRRAA